MVWEEQEEGLKGEFYLLYAGQPGLVADSTEYLMEALVFSK